jgi:hypothetical protein
MHSLGIGIAAIRQGDIADTERKVLEGFPRVDVADQDLDKLSGPKVHRDMEAVVRAFGTWRLNTTPVNDDKAQPIG